MANLLLCAFRIARDLPRWRLLLVDEDRAKTRGKSKRGNTGEALALVAGVSLFVEFALQ